MTDTKDEPCGKPELCKSWLPPRHRIAELFFTGVVIGGFGLYLHWVDSRALQLMGDLKKSSNQLLGQQIGQQATIQGIVDAKSKAILASTLIQYITCSNNTETRRMAINILRGDAADELTHILAIISDCKDLPSDTKDDLLKIRDSADIVGLENAFVQRVRIGEQYYNDQLWKEAAQSWYDATQILPQSFIENKTIYMDTIFLARSKFYDNEYIASSDLYRKAFHNIIPQ